MKEWRRYARGVMGDWWRRNRRVEWWSNRAEEGKSRAHEWRSGGGVEEEWRSRGVEEECSSGVKNWRSSGGVVEE